MTIQPLSMIGAIDLGTSSTRFLLFEKDTFKVVYKQRSSVPLIPISKKTGWAEMCPIQIYQSVVKAIEESKSATNADLKAIGIVNQRESILAWDAESREPLTPTILWYDTRTSDLVKKYKKKDVLDPEFLFTRCGLPLSTYFSALKIKWLTETEPYASAIKHALKQSKLRIGTLDTWILDRLTGGKSYFTDITNASRTALMNINTCQWDKSLFEFFEIDFLFDVFPVIKSNCDHFGIISIGSSIDGIPITAMLGDQHASLLGHGCLNIGEMKATYGTGGFLMMNIGPSKMSAPGLLTKIGFKLGKTSPLVFALEGPIAMAGRLMTWLEETLHIPPTGLTIDEYLKNVTDSNGVIFLSSLTGMFAPVWKPDCKGSIYGLSLETKSENIGIAALESIGFQAKMIIDLMQSNTHANMPSEIRLSVDGGLAFSDRLCQILADVLSFDVIRPTEQELTSLGGAVAAAIGADPDNEQQILKNLLQSASINDTTVFTHHHSIGVVATNDTYTEWRKRLDKELF